MRTKKPEILAHYQDIARRRGRDYAIQILRDAVRDTVGEQSQIRRGILVEEFGVYDAPPVRRGRATQPNVQTPITHVSTIHQIPWDKQLADLLSDETPIYLVEEIEIPF